jgi:hypothetical protein cdivTM_12249
MNIFTKAWLSIRRRPKKNLLLSLIISITLLLLFFISSIKFNLDSLEKSIEKTVPFGINIKNKNHENLNEKDIQKLINLKEITKSNYQASALVSPINQKTVTDSTSGLTLDQKQEEKLTFLGAKSINLLNEFTSNLYKLDSGSLPNDSSKREVLIHKEFAAKNNLKSGDYFEIKKDHKKIRVKVVGIFAGQNEKSKILDSDMAENQIITTFKTLKELETNPNLENLDLFSENKQVEEELEDKVKKLLPRHEDYEISKISNSYQGFLTNIKSLQQIILSSIILTSLASITVLTLVLVFHIRNRIHEIGILLSIGITKTQIFCQFIIELLILSFIPIVVSLVFSSYFSKVITTQILTNNETIGSIKIASLDTSTMVLLSLIGLGFLLIPLFISLLPIMFKSPRKILTNLN